MHGKINNFQYVYKRISKILLYPKLIKDQNTPKSKTKQQNIAGKRQHGELCLYKVAQSVFKSTQSTTYIAVCLNHSVTVTFQFKILVCAQINYFSVVRKTLDI